MYTNKIIYLSSLTDGMPGLTSACGGMLAESACACLEDRGHQAGVRLDVAGIRTEGFQLEWSASDDQLRRCYNDLQEATEFGACGIAILITKEITGLVVTERSRKGLGFDYWLGHREDDTLFSGKIRLEVSGILSATATTVNTRINQKKRQLVPSDHLAVALIAVIDFGTPRAHLEEK